MLPAVLALGAAASWGVADFLGGVSARALPLAVVAVRSQAVGLVVLLAVLAVEGLPGLPGAVVAWGALTGLAYAAGLGAFYRGLASGRMGLVAPLAGTGAAVPVAVGVATGDVLSGMQVAGVLLAITGIVLTTREGAGEGAPRGGTRAAVALGVVAAVGIGVSLVGIERAVEGRPVSAVLWVLVVMRITALAVWLPVALRTGSGALLRRPPGRTLVALGVLDALANVLFGLAVRESLLALAAVLASLHPVVTVLLARLLLGERLRVVQQAGVGLAVAGVALLTA